VSDPSPPSPLSTGASVGLLIALLCLCFGVAAVGGLSTAQGVQGWYPTLDKPPWTPPNWAFGPIWTVLYTAMALAAWDVARRGVSKAKVPLGLFAFQLVLNALWSPVFFAWQQTGVAWVVISALWLAIAVLIVLFRKHSTLGSILLVPYWLWISVAWSLNAWIFHYNP